MNNIYDSIIIGAGISGMTAAIYLKRYNLNVLIIEKEIPGGQISKASLIENYPGIKKTDGITFSTNLLNQIETAKEFLKFIASNRGLEIFRDATNGCRPPFDYSGVPEASESTFRQSVNAVIAKSTNYGGSQKKDKIFSIGEINADLFNNNYGRFVGVFAAKNKADYHNALEYYMAEVKAVNDALNNAKIKAGV